MAMIDIIDLCKSYGSGAEQVHALKNINLQVERGEIFGVIGFSGAGKSSLIRCVNMLETPTSGRILVDGQDMTALHGKDLRQARKKIGMIFQHFNLLETATVYQNIAVALELNGLPKAQIQQKVAELLALVGLKDKANAYPSQLSGGQKQRVAIARALANDVDVLLCDEATSALDPQTTEAILELLLDINRQMNITIMLITHEMNVIKKVCDRVAVLENGEIIEQNTTLELFVDPQQPTTRNFLGSILDEKLPQSVLDKIRERDPNCQVVRLTFVGANTSMPLLSQIAKALPLAPNILSGSILQVKDETLGRLVIELSGEPSAIQQAMDMIAAAQVRAEVLHQ